MSTGTIGLSTQLQQYLLNVSVRESDLLARLRQETAKLPRALMQIAPEQGQFLKLLIQLTAARRVLEIGVFTGYSSLCMAEAMPPGGKLVACGHNEEWTAIAGRYWREAGVLDRIDLQLGPALATLQKLNDSGETGSFDLRNLHKDPRIDLSLVPIGHGLTLARKR